MRPSTILLKNTVFLGEIVMHDRKHSICQHFIHIHIGVYVAVEDNKTRHVVSCNSSPYGSTRDVLVSVLTFPLPSESCPVDDSPLSAGPDVVVLASGCLLRSLFDGRVIPGVLLSIHCNQTMLQCFVWINPP